ncbi:hypothetical protein CBER1_04054 [Cercospora berteroae]|uniref:YDG domain-containing protein n=1 Tax=Cercospora berteroae TaxID=357750 RepID=A0A2S6C4Z5_9PEZI|nr:hypothetical protein CBER1_04054 [Cercospora berteroae]
MGNELSKTDTQPSEDVARLQARLAKLEKVLDGQPLTEHGASEGHSELPADQPEFDGVQRPHSKARDGTGPVRNGATASEDLNILPSNAGAGITLPTGTERAEAKKHALRKQAQLIAQQRAKQPQQNGSDAQQAKSAKASKTQAISAHVEESPSELHEADTLAGWDARKERCPKSSAGSSNNSRTPDLPLGNKLSDRTVSRDKSATTDPIDVQQVGAAFRTSPTQSTNVRADFATSLPSNPTQSAENAPTTSMSNKRTAPAANLQHSSRPGPRDKPATKRPRVEMASPAAPVAPYSASSDVSLQPPEWYSKLSISTKRGAGTSNADTLLQRIKDQITKLKKSGPNVHNLKEMNELREMLHEAPFLAMGPAGAQLVRNKRMLHNDGGLPQLFDDRHAGSMAGHWPWDVKSDAKELYYRWCSKNFDDNLLHGIITSQKGKHAEDDRSADQVDKTCQVSSKYIGNGKLVNGQWWPTLLCALRDGAHGDSQSGISGETNVAAYSCFMSGGKNHIYDDKDMGDVVEYCGQDSDTPGQVSRGTSLLQKNLSEKVPVRFIRSYKVNSKYAPSKGFRYDGLYDVVSSELLDESKGRYRFKLVRRPGQGPIRGGDGPEARPTKQEVSRFEQDKRFRGYGKD